MAQAESEKRAASESKHLLIVDTDPGVRWSLEKGLEHSGFTVHCASTAEQAIELSQVQPISGVLFELMPESGLTMDILLSLVQAPGAPKVVCTSID